MNLHVGLTSDHFSAYVSARDFQSGSTWEDESNLVMGGAVMVQCKEHEDGKVLLLEFAEVVRA